jgi:MraZ protein
VPTEDTTAEPEADADGARDGEPRFWGTHEHAVDAKGRVILPARFREPFRAGAFITKLPEGCLGVWTSQEFERMTAAMLEKGRKGQAERNVARVWAAGTFDTAPDGQGRLAIPAQLRAYARLDSDVVVNGAINHLEIWNAQKWADIDSEGSQYLLSGTDALDEIGF